MGKSCSKESRKQIKEDVIKVVTDVAEIVVDVGETVKDVVQIPENPVVKIAEVVDDIKELKTDGEELVKSVKKVGKDINMSFEEAGNFIGSIVEKTVKALGFNKNTVNNANLLPISITQPVEEPSTVVVQTPEPIIEVKVEPDLVVIDNADEMSKTQQINDLQAQVAKLTVGHISCI